MSDAPKIACRPNGPYLLEGPLEIQDPTGKVIPVAAGKKIALCRCGGSAGKPFCDGAHARIGFQATEAAVVKG